MKTTTLNERMTIRTSWSTKNRLLGLAKKENQTLSKLVDAILRDHLKAQRKR